MINVTLLAFSVVVIAVAWYWNTHLQRQNQPRQQPTQDPASAVKGLVNEAAETTTIYAIGDLHGDARCAQEWVDRTGLIEGGAWKNDQTHLVFLGDYVDKGATSKQTVLFVKSLTDRFPSHVSAILGNHEIELLRDRTAKIWADGVAGYYQLVYGAVHPGDYLNYLDETDDDDQKVVDALYNASLRVYGGGKHRSVYMVPDPEYEGTILNFVDPVERDLVKEKLTQYQAAYLDAYRSNTTLGKWLEERPVAAVVESTLFVHGGFHPKAVSYLPDIAAIEKLNAALAAHASEDKFADFMSGTTMGQLVYNIVVYRGNHKISSCEELVLPKQIERLAVGHTPGRSVRTACGARFLALDSSLSRWFRNSGNQYCHGDSNHIDGNFQCTRKVNKCEGQIVRIRGDDVDILDMDAKEATTM